MSYTASEIKKTLAALRSKDVDKIREVGIWCVAVTDKNEKMIPVFVPKHDRMQPMTFENIVRYFVTLLVENHHAATNPFRIGTDSEGNMSVVFDPFGAGD
eukprot:SAG31_NODE_11989_length_977_cov_2.721591_2_plen_100_part_00